MCRIAGIISEQSATEKLARQVQAMCTMMRHGGPDDEGMYSNDEGTACFGNRRLSVLDLSIAGHQPMLSDDKNLCITYNGEIYNFKEIRAELITLGYKFHSETDTEVILKAYKHWGTNSFKRFKGMFAFALFDQADKKTYLVRDPGGIKPLYYATSYRDLIFASEVKAFTQTSYSFHTDENWKIYLLAFGHIPEPFTTFKEVKSLAKGNFLTWDHQTCTSSISTFYSFKYSQAITDPAIATDQIKLCLIESVKRHLISDASIGIFLSGGIDSSILTLIAHEFQQENLHTISVNLQEADYSEKKYQQLVTELVKGKHSEYLFSYEKFADSFETIFSDMDQPCTDGINSWYVSKCAKESGLKAVLSGLGADELLGGYPSFHRMDTIALLKKLPKKFLTVAEKHPNPKYKRLYYLSYNNPIGEYLFLRGFYTPALIAEILNADRKAVDELLSNFPVNNELNNLKGGNRASWMETNLYMQNQLLKDTDYMSMSQGIEVRVPFLDHDLVETILSIHPDIKFNKSQNKTLLINAFKDILPEPIWKRKKMGFTFPFQEWMKRLEKISDPGNYENNTSKKLINNFCKGKLHWSSAFALYHINNA
jgi:asparagine synthase (glutamine-hydrolysing)